MGHGLCGFLFGHAHGIGKLVDMLVSGHDGLMRCLRYSADNLASDGQINVEIHGLDGVQSNYTVCCSGTAIAFCFTAEHPVNLAMMSFQMTGREVL